MAATMLEKIYALFGDALSYVRGVAVGSVDDAGTWSPASAGNPLPVTLGAATEGISVGAATTNSALQFGGAGAAGDYLAILMIRPLTTSPGAVTFKDGSGGASVTAFTGGANSVNTLHPFPFIVNAKAESGPWYVTTGADVAVWVSGEPAH